MTDIELKELLLSRYNDDDDRLLNADYRNDARWSVYIHIVPKSANDYNYDKYYVGITSFSLKKRFQSGLGYRDQVFGRAIEKYGWENIEHYLISDNLTEAEAKSLEKTLIILLKTRSKYGYNFTDGGDGVLGITLSDEIKKRMSESNKKRYKNPDYRDKMLNIHLENIQAAINSTKIKVVLLNENKVFDSMADAARYTELSPTSITNNINGTICTKCDSNGYPLVFRLYDDYIALKDNEINEILEHNKRFYSKKARSRIVCLNTREVFDYTFMIEEKYRVNRNNVANCCARKIKSTGKLPNGEKLVWAFYEDYINMSDDDIFNRIKYANTLQKNKNKKSCIKVVDLLSMKVYPNTVECSKATNVSLSTLRATVSQNRKTKLKNRFVSYDNYLKNNNISDKEARKSLFFVE